MKTFISLFILAIAALSAQEPAQSPPTPAPKVLTEAQQKEAWRALAKQLQAKEAARQADVRLTQALSQCGDGQQMNESATGDLVCEVKK